MIYNDSLEKFRSAVSLGEECICGIDYGLKKVGIAISDRNSRIAFPYITLPNDKRLVESITRILKEHKVKSMVVGLPIDLNAGLHPLYRNIMEFLETITSTVDINILLWDERMSTRGAIRNILDIPKWDRKSGKQPRNFAAAEKKMIQQDDHYAAAYILQEVLDKLNANFDQ